MKAEGIVTFGGAAIGSVGADIMLDNGQKWSFLGTILGLEVGVGVCKATGDFPGVSHMEGPCTVSIVGAAVGPGAFKITWSDTHGTIGVLNGDGAGGNISFAGGIGGWWRS
jgi:hypothetical protein